MTNRALICPVFDRHIKETNGKDEKNNTAVISFIRDIDNRDRQLAKYRQTLAHLVFFGEIGLILVCAIKECMNIVFTI